MVPDEPIWYDVYQICLNNEGLSVVSIDYGYLDNYKSDIIEIPDIFDNISSYALKQITSHYYCREQPYTFKMDGLKYLRDEAFSNDTYLSKIYLESCKILKDGCLKLCSELKVVYAPNVKYIEDEALSHCNNLIGFIGKPSYICDRAFMRCYNLQNFDFSNVLKMGESSFAFTGLKVCKANRCLEIEQYCFHRSKLEIFEGNRLKKLNRGVFESSCLMEFKGDNLVEICEDAFYRADLTEFTSNSVKYVHVSAFHQLNKLEYISLSKVKKITNTFIKECPNLRSVRLEGCQSISSYVYRDCEKLESFYLPSLKVFGIYTLLKANENITLYLNKDIIVDDEYRFFNFNKIYV